MERLRLRLPFFFSYLPSYLPAILSKPSLGVRVVFRASLSPPPDTSPILRVLAPTVDLFPPLCTFIRGPCHYHRSVALSQYPAIIPASASLADPLTVFS